MSERYIPTGEEIAKAQALEGALRRAEESMVVTLSAPPEILNVPPVVSDNPHRAKKLKGRNRRKW